MNKDSTKSRTVNFHQLPPKLWKKLKKHLPKGRKKNGPGRPRVNNRNVINGIWYVLWSGCQWKAVKREWFQVSSSTLHERFQTWQEKGVFDKLFQVMVNYYAHEMKIGWKWQSVDSKMVSAPLGGAKTGKNPTDRAKSGAKIHLLVDERGAPLAIHITGANEHDKWSVDDLIVHIVKKRPNSEQHFCADKGYDSEDIFQFVKAKRYVPHIKHRRRRNEPKVEECPIPGEKSFPARRWVVERTLGWLAKRRSIKIRWCKKPENWLAFLKLAAADILLKIIFGLVLSIIYFPTKGNQVVKALTVSEDLAGNHPRKFRTNTRIMPALDGGRTEVHWNGIGFRFIWPLKDIFPGSSFVYS